ncbi:TlpA family protein disulfide reductase [Empedobacter tilapiae]|uniref:TlpA family protein disulfide reductase n=1 Tax=Empedobacter tilapiae TaxID=2491114 RepID=A0A4Z1BV99_9FLAO|nr:TlpA disulfide reductase family protein [Empedobacter tilapiae]TGN30013.1 TlpA family protein disulfide reductase [Empedobacter tilapiae]
MKNKFILPLVVLGSSVFGQFNVSGQLENYANKPVLVKIFENAELKLIKNTKTDNNGNFSTNIPKEYNGFVRIDLPSGENISLLTDNKNLKFKTGIGQEMTSKLQIIEGDTQKEYNKVLTLQPLNEVQNQVFPYLMQIYKPTDEFYIAMVKEDKRINELKRNENFSGLITYINELNDLKQKAQNNRDTENIEAIVNHFVKDDERLEQSGIFNDLVFAYINGKLATAGNQDVEGNLIKATDEILAKTDIQTARGQNVLTTILNFVPEKEYSNFHKKYVDKVNGLTCKITDQLKKRVGLSISTQIGNKVPNITFEKAINGKKSLYDIKANQKLIVFWASWCPACQQEIPYIKEFYKDFKAKGGEIVAISLDYDEKAFNNAIKELPWYNYSDLLRWDSPIAAEFGINSTPTLLLIDKDNKLIKKFNHISELETSK